MTIKMKHSNFTFVYKELSHKIISFDKYLTLVYKEISHKIISF